MKIARLRNLLKRYIFLIYQPPVMFVLDKQSEKSVNSEIGRISVPSGSVFSAS